MKRRNHLGELRLDGRIILKLILNKQLARLWIAFV
jgi:hypothetical protein